MTTNSANVTEIVQIQGGVGNPTAQVQATRLTDRFAAVTGAQAKYLAAPGLVGSKAVRDGLLADPYIAEVTNDWNQLNVALLGIGALQPSPLLKDSGNTISEADMQLLRDAGAVGDVCLHFFDAEGRVVSSELDERIISIAANQLFAVPRRVGFAGGKRKSAAIQAAAKAKWIDVLITDSVTAKEILRGL
jgi:DNA-binding transcriptional regulator LsrR (DeoR family)